MTRGRQDELSIAELERLLVSKRSSILKLNKKRGELLKKLAEVDREIASLGGLPGRSDIGRTPGGRVRNGITLVAAMEAVLRARSPMKVGEILSAVLATGYRSTSDSFRGIVNQTLIKDKRFHSAGRGVYTVK